jgi:ribosomal protein S18 acetylase RimI-like enzyme
MAMEYRFGHQGIDWQELCDVIEKAPLGTREPERMRKACEGSQVVLTAYDQSRIVGFVRAISDGVIHSAVYDLVVLPDYQGRGVGKKLMQLIMERLPMERGVVLLYAAIGKQDFYHKLGFANLKTGMARFPNPQQRREQGYIE